MLAFVINAAWWGLVTIPLLKNYRQNYYVGTKSGGVRESFVRLSNVFGELKNNKRVTFNS